MYSPEEVGKWLDITGRKQPSSLQLTQQGETRETLCAVGQILLEGNGIDVFGSQPLRDVLNKHLVGIVSVVGRSFQAVSWVSFLFVRHDCFTV